MVVTASAAERQAQKRLRRRPHNIVQLVEAVLLRVGRLVVPRPEPVETGGNDGFGICVGQFVAGDLFQDETVVRLVGIERIDHPIAILPDIGLGGVALVTVGLGVSNQIEPVPSPSLAISGIGQQAID